MGVVVVERPQTQLHTWFSREIPDGEAEAVHMTETVICLHPTFSATVS